MSFVVHAPPIASPESDVPVQSGNEAPNKVSMMMAVRKETTAGPVDPETESRKAASQDLVGMPSFKGLVK
jgi:hypothetical protein